MRSFRALWSVILCLVLIGGRGTVLQAQSLYKETTVTNGARISGRVLLGSDVPRSVMLSVTKDAICCGVSQPQVRLRVGKSKSVENTIVWLDGIREGKTWKQGNSLHVLDQHKCQYSPHILLLPYGSALDIVNSDPILHNVHAYDEVENGKTLFNIAQPIKGQRTSVKHTQFRKPGLYLATCDAGHPWMNAYIMVADNPYYALTDANGRFTFDHVPAGTYKLKMWHEGVAVVRTEMENGKPKAYEYEEPYEEEKEVTVPPNGNVVVDFSLVLRLATSDGASGSSSSSR